jgi:ParB/RepB/Spo0J family partition protein
MADENRLPDSYDELIPIEQLRHGSHNVRHASPSEELKSSVEKRGINDAIVVRPADGDAYHITDGWQRYQAAVELGWTELPANIYRDTLQALKAAETQSIVREWTTFQWANHARSLCEELTTTETAVDNATVETVAEQISKSKPTVRRYLNALRLPELLHPLLKQRQNITEDEWKALQNYKPDIRRYNGLSWKVAAEAGARCDQVSKERIITTVTEAVEYDADDGITFVNEAIDDPEVSLAMIQYRLFDGSGGSHKYLRVPQMQVRLEEEKRESVMDYCHNRKIHLSDLIEKQVKQFAEHVDTDEETLGNFS